MNKNITVLTRNEGWKKPREGWMKCNSMLLIKTIDKRTGKFIGVGMGKRHGNDKKLGASKD